MGKKIRTSVVLTAKAEGILQKHRNAFGLKKVLSVGLELFDALSDTEQKARVSEAEKEDQLAASLVKAARTHAAKQRKGRARKPPAREVSGPA